MKPEKQLYQWDVNQYLTDINPAAKYVDYQMGNEVIRIETDGTRCRIPDEVLQTYGGKTCYERYPDGTYRAYSFSVLYAPKPPDYIYTPEERTTFEALTARVDAAIEEIKRRADSGEFTPKKGVDYYTEGRFRGVHTEKGRGLLHRGGESRADRERIKRSSRRIPESC